MAGTIVVDRLESDASYASSINVASPMVISNTISMGSAAAISGNVNIDSGLLFVNAVTNRVGINTTTLAANTSLCVSGDIKLNYTTPTNANARIYALNSTFDPYTLAVSGGAAINFQRISNSDEIAFETHHTGNSHRETMRISKEGYVTAPYQPYFAAHVTSGSATYTSVAEATAFPANSTAFNVGSHYNTTTYRFTAPIAGNYLFTWSGITGTNNVISRPMFFVNGASAYTGGMQFGISGGDSGSPQNSTSAIIRLNASDYVDVRSQAGRLYYYNSSHSSFTGILLS
jgi:hypothetical protein